MNNWISVEQELPINWSDKDGQIEVCVGGGSYSGSAWFFKIGKRRGWLKVTKPFTHWQQLPLPPEQDK